MQCEIFEKIWIEYGTESLPPAAREHLETCASCRALIGETEDIARRLSNLSSAPMPGSVKKAILKKTSNPFYSPDLILNIVTLLGLAVFFGSNLDIILHGIISCTHNLTQLLINSPWYFFPLGGLILGSLIIPPVLRKIL